MYLSRRRLLHYLYLISVCTLFTLGLCHIIRDIIRAVTVKKVLNPPVSAPNAPRVDDATPESNVQPEVKPRHVLILSYQRSGSTFAGELFNQHPEGVYWFEPLDDAYSSMYGTEYGWNVPGDIFTHSNGINRSIPSYEMMTLVDSLENIFNCNPDQLPTEILAHKFMAMFSNEQLSLKGYRKCLEETGAMELSRKCRNTIAAVCPKRFDSEDQHTAFCGDYLMKHPTNLLRDEIIKGNEVNKLEEYTKCQESVKTKLENCLVFIKDSCTKAKIIATRTVRVTMATVQELLRRDKDLLVIIYIRDPRGMVISKLRSSESFWSKYASKDMVKEAEIICAQILRDVRLAKELEKSRPGSILTVIYEDLAINSRETLHKIYNFVGLPVPQIVDQWLHENTHTNDKPNSRTSRPSAKTAYNWTNKMTYATVLKINNHCGELFEELGHPWP